MQNLEEAFSSLIAAAAATCDSSPLVLHIDAALQSTTKLSSLIAGRCNFGTTLPLALHCALGEPSNLISGKIWDFGPTEGGGLPIPNFHTIFPEQT